MDERTQEALLNVARAININAQEVVVRWGEAMQAVAEAIATITEQIGDVFAELPNLPRPPVEIKKDIKHEKNPMWYRRQKLIKINIDRLRHSIAVDGAETKQIIAMEEMAELTQQISKVLRNQSERELLIEEYADVIICLNMLKIIHDIKDEEVQSWINYKLDRQAERDKRRIPNG